MFRKYPEDSELSGASVKLFICFICLNSISAYECLKREVHRPEIKETASAQFLGTKFDPPWKNKNPKHMVFVLSSKTSPEKHPLQALNMVEVQ